MASPSSPTTLVVFNAVSGNSAVHDEASSFDPDSFDFSKAMAQLACKNTNATMPSDPSDVFSRLPKDVLKKVLGVLLISTQPLVLGVDEDTPVSNGLELAILRSSRYICMIGTEILYGCNDITTSSPATSFDFDKDLLHLPGKNLQLIRHIQLEIDWADKLWAKFPLIASVLGSIRGLQSLKITMVPDAYDHAIEDVNLWPMPAMLTPNLTQNSEASKASPARNGFSRQGAMAEVMLKAEKKMLTKLVLGLQALQVFQLHGFVDGAFAKNMEDWVANGRRVPSSRK
ncbi:MAG: hypothetical protein Q9195_001075 [Heterodermia aff. obscurata]